MQKPSFELELEIDANGVMVTRLRGVFDAEEWLRQRDRVRQRDYAHLDLHGRPIVCDIRDCTLPEADWTGQFSRVYSALQERHRGPFRRAIITDDDFGRALGVKLFTELEAITLRDGIETRGFTDFNEGYAWAAEPWLRR